jgi:hypothetical protein
MAERQWWSDVDVCSMTLEPLNHIQDRYTLVPCGHTFSREAIMGYRDNNAVNTKCPVCRQECPWAWNERTRFHMDQNRIEKEAVRRLRTSTPDAALTLDTDGARHHQDGTDNTAAAEAETTAAGVAGAGGYFRYQSSTVLPPAVSLTARLFPSRSLTPPPPRPLPTTATDAQDPAHPSHVVVARTRSSSIIRPRRRTVPAPQSPPSSRTSNDDDDDDYADNERDGSDGNHNDDQHADPQPRNFNSGGYESSEIEALRREIREMPSRVWGNILYTTSSLCAVRLFWDFAIMLATSNVPESMSTLGSVLAGLMVVSISRQYI